MTEEACVACGKASPTKDAVGLTRKLIDRRATRFYCLSCLAKTIGVTEAELSDKIREFKEAGCALFQ